MSLPVLEEVNSMSQIAFYILSDVHGFIFPTDFSSRGKRFTHGVVKSQSSYRARLRAL